MISSHLQGLHLTPILVVATVLLFLYLSYNKYCQGLNHIPGPLLASCTDLWRLRQAQHRRPELAHVRLHEKHGSLVRIGPNSVSVSDPGAIPIVYALNSGFVKSDFYAVQQTLSKGNRLFTLFTSLDERFHARLRRSVSNAYAMSTLVQFEKYIDSTTIAFLGQMKSRFADKPKSKCNLSAWLQWYAFDVIGELTFSKRLGFIDGGEDVEGVIQSIENMFDYAAVVRF